MALTIAQFTKTNTKGVVNTLPPEYEANYLRIKPYIDRILDLFPAVLNSGYRSPILNKRIGGSPTSYHCLALAADIDSNSSNKQIFQYILDSVPFDVVIWEKGNDQQPDWVHFQLAKTGEEPRRIIHRFHFRANKWIYRPCDRNGKLITL
jgi:hypothetical protein